MICSYRITMVEQDVVPVGVKIHNYLSTALWISSVIVISAYMLYSIHMSFLVSLNETRKLLFPTEA